MSIEILADLTEIRPSSPEWLQLRKLGIGGSDAGAIVGVNPRRTAYEIWAEKVNPTVPEWEDEPEYMTWGKLLEPVVRDEFSRRTGIEVHPLPKMIRNTDYPWMLANVDGVTGPVEKLTGAYEGKTWGGRGAEQWAVNEDGSVQVPLPHMVQGMHYLAVLDLQIVHFACLIGGQQLRIAEVHRDEQLIADLIEIEEAFWRSVIDREPPAATGQDLDTLKKRWQPEEGKTIELPESFAAELRTRVTLVEGIKALEEQRDDIDARIMAAMGDAETAKIGDKVVATWKGTPAKVKWGEMVKAHPEIAAEYMGEPSRRFLPKQVEAEQEETAQ